VDKTIREVIGTSCCRYYHTGITHPDLALLSRVAKIIRAKHGWNCHMVRDELATPTWRVYISDTKMSKPDLEQLKRKEGPAKVFKDTLNGLKPK